MEWRFEDELVMRNLKSITVLQSQSIEKSCPVSINVLGPRAPASPVHGKRDFRDDAKPRLNRLGMALRE